MVTLESLYRDHDNLKRILYLLEQLLIDIYRGTSPDYPMLQRILVYIQEYPERIHHPAEDAMFAIILNNKSCPKRLYKDISSLLKDHSEIENITREAIEAVESVVVSTHTDLSELGKNISRVLDRQRRHILFEEMHIYPYITKYLETGDWEKVSALLPDINDPVFGDKIKSGYESIIKAL